MKIKMFLLIALFVACQKKDKINHYINEKVTQQDLIKNGFYRYSYSTMYDDKGNKRDTTKFLVKYDMYSNVKPERNEKGEICPTQLLKYTNLDSTQKAIHNNYLKKDLNNRIITYLFRNDTLFYKNIVVYSLDKSRREIVDLTNKEKIVKYYDSVKVPIKPLLESNNSMNTSMFLIGNYKTRIYYSQNEKSYDIFVNYVNGAIYRNILDNWYCGYMTNPHYYLKYDPALLSL